MTSRYIIHKAKPPVKDGYHNFECGEFKGVQNWSPDWKMVTCKECLKTKSVKQRGENGIEI